jgi:hypothetical protein
LANLLESAKSIWSIIKVRGIISDGNKQNLKFIFNVVLKVWQTKKEIIFGGI